jgi:hypothetical protein
MRAASPQTATGTKRKCAKVAYREGKWVFFLLVTALFLAAWWAWQTLFQTAF